ncbi:MAG: aspartate--tRNA(Asn) ligase [Methanobacteriaceae archaeon]|jgi:aspartyl-tRNA synthetase|uniref:aspartate--tRNA(Asn) ligase n=1 Tax=Methanobrevibacter TaxID=2172 RepID=UPI00375D0F81|nr:aspartate--tRNA(Asn) ligase [Methanobacteriaceae archaeon]MDD4593809.1 aspartate--tRNA(Asn) ligase [Methanobacteriaceae archaeon]
MEYLLNDWRRTHYTNKVNPTITGEEIVIMGWVHEIRDLGGIIFVLVRDREGMIQVTAPSKKVTKEILEDLRGLSKESVIAVKGKVQDSNKAPNGVEIIPEEIKVLNLAQQPLPMDPTEKVKAEIDTRLDSRFLDLRVAHVSSIFKIKDNMFKTVREYFDEEGIMEIHTPKLVASATEGGTELFPITYFEREAFLGQSPQLYKQMMMSAGFDKVFEIGQIFRAEEHDTLRHLNEAVSIDMEASFMDDKDAMEILDKMISRVLRSTNENCKDQLEILNQTLDIPEGPFPEVKYDDAVDIVNSKGVEMEWGEDLSRAGEKALGESQEGFYFLTEWPTAIKPFYVMPQEDRPEISHAFDLMYKDLEISSGATRIHQYDLLKNQLEAKGLNVDAFADYLKAFRYGMPPHAGWGVGSDRLNMVLTGVENIRETVLFPRDRRRLTP